MSDPYPAYPKPKYQLVKPSRIPWPTGVNGLGEYWRCPECKQYGRASRIVHCEDCGTDLCPLCAQTAHLPNHFVFWVTPSMPWIQPMTQLKPEDLLPCIKTNCGCPKYAHEDSTGVCHLCLLRDTGFKDMKEMANLYFCNSFVHPDNSIESGMNEVDKFLRTFDESASKTNLKVPITSDDLLYTACERKYGWTWQFTKRIIEQCLKAGRIVQISYSRLTSHNYGPALVRTESWDDFQRGTKKA